MKSLFSFCLIYRTSSGNPKLSSISMQVQFHMKYLWDQCLFGIFLPCKYRTIILHLIHNWKGKAAKLKCSP